MRNRWFHRPQLHSPLPGQHRRVGWLELFYDLVYVAALLQLGNALSKHVTIPGFVAFAGLFAALWYSWTGFTFFSNRFLVDDFLHRLLVFVQMFGVASMAVLVSAVMDGQNLVPFALAYVVVRLSLVALYLRTAAHADHGRALSVRYAVWFGAGSLLWLGSTLLPAPWIWLVWGAALLFEMMAPISRQLRELTRRFPPDVEHLSERFGIFTIIVLGESFVKILTDLASQSAIPDPRIALLGGLGLLVTCSVWWIYFDDVVHSVVIARPGARFVWLYAHLPLTIGITAAAVGMKKSVSAGIGGKGGVSDDPTRWLLMGSLALVFASVAALDEVTERRGSNLDDRARVWVRLASAGFLLLLAGTGSVLPAWFCLSLVAVVCLAQVLLDLAMAPFEEPELDHESMQSSFGAADERIDREARARRYRRRDPLEAVRSGAPSELRRGLYYFFMEGSWWRLLGSAVLLYLFLNLSFAALYTVDQGGIANARPESFLDAFFFSVQTISTIGYGTLSPASEYTNTLVVVEAVCGLLLAAMVTGLVFAKASRPTASVLFSDVLTVTTFEGQPALILRLGNARGNEVVEASLKLSAICQEQTAEGHDIRRIRDLPLVRDSSPMFILTWTAIHLIDEQSPFFGMEEETLRERVLVLTATMTGFDGTFGQTIHARKLWYSDDVRWHHRFVDVLSELDDGRLHVDYSHFHDTLPEHPTVRREESTA